MASKLSRCAFRTPRLEVRVWLVSDSGDEVADLARTVVHLLTPAVTAPLPDSWQGRYSEDRAAAWIRDRDAEGLNLLALDAATGAPVGLLLLHDSSDALEPEHELRLGYLIGESHRGRGYATELLRGFLEWARGSAYRRVFAGVSSDNHASVRVLEKSGFSEVESGSPTRERLYVIAV